MPLPHSAAGARSMVAAGANEVACARADRERIGEFASLVPVDGFITLRECRRKGFSEAETRQSYLLEPALFEVYEHAPPNGGPLSVRIRRPGSVGDSDEGRWAS